jgi:hypothetical protein
MPKKGQTMRFTDAELSLIKGLFAENDALLYALRKSLLGFVLDENESAIIKGLSKEALKLIRKTFLPTLDPASPFFQLTDMAMGLNVDIKEKSEDEALPLIIAKAIEIQYMDEALRKVEGEDATFTYNLNDLSLLTDENVFVNITARNYLLSYIDSNCKQLEFLAGTKDETVEQTVARLQKNSNK